MKPSSATMENNVQPAAFGSVPIPDPTKLTTEALEKSVASLRELQDTKVDALRDKLETRMAEQEKAVVLLRQFIDQIPSIIMAKIDTLRTLHQEKFESVATQFRERDTRMEQTSKDNKVAVDAAFSAQTKAIEKAEAGFTKQIDGISTQIATVSKTLDDKIAAVKDLYSSLANIQSGAQSLVTGKEEGNKAVWVAIGTGIGILVALIGTIPILISVFSKGP